MDSAAANPPKRAKLQSLRARLPYISGRGLSALLKLAKHEPLPDVYGRASMQRARDDVAFTSTPYGKLHQTIRLPATAGGEVTVEIQTPCAMLAAASKVSGAFSALLKETATACPPSIQRPWRTAIYFDEVLPGNALAHKHARKMWACYWSVLEWGGGVLAHEVDASHARVACR